MDNKSVLLTVDLCKGKGNRDGLVQQIVTYVRDGRTITRKQWVRSEFAEHAKKNEEEKKKALLRRAERERKKREHDIAETNKKHKEKDESDARKFKKKNEKAGISDKDLEKDAVLKELIKQRKESSKRQKAEEDKRKQEEDKSRNKNKREQQNQNKEKRGRFGQTESTREDLKRESDILQQTQRESIH